MNNTTKYVLIAAIVIVVVILVSKFQSNEKIVKTKTKTIPKKSVDDESEDDKSDSDKLSDAANAAEAARIKKLVDDINAKIKAANKPLATIRKIFRR